LRAMMTVVFCVRYSVSRRERNRFRWKEDVFWANFCTT